MLKQATEVFLFKDNKILLGHKKRGIGTGKLLGIGGHVEPGERILETAVREVEEEIFVTLKESQLQPIAVFDYIFPAKPKWTMEVHFFFAKSWSGTPQESDEMKPLFFDLNQIPYDKMWQDSALWFPNALNGQRQRGIITFGDDNQTVISHSIQEWVEEK